MLLTSQYAAIRPIRSSFRYKIEKFTSYFPESKNGVGGQGTRSKSLGEKKEQAKANVGHNSQECSHKGKTPIRIITTME